MQTHSQGPSLDIQMTGQYATHTHTLLTPRGAGSTCRRGAEAPPLMDVDLHPEVMDVGVTACSRPGVERGTRSWWTLVGTLSRYADKKSPQSSTRDSPETMSPTRVKGQ